MGLADLKKNSTPSKIKSKGRLLSPRQTLDSFIDGATLYAAGIAQNDEAVTEGSPQKSKVVSLIKSKPLTRQHQFDDWKSSTLASNRVKYSDGGPYRKATFNLSESAITHLAALIDNDALNRSKLIRILIEQHYSLSEEERKRWEKRILG